jgi:hypothetical protein
MVAKKVIAPELLAEARRLYEQTLAPVDDIAGMLGMSRTPFYRRVKEGCWRRRRARVATFEFARSLSSSAAAVLLPGWPQMGLIVRSHEIIDGLQRQFFPAELKTIQYDGSRRGTDRD